MMSFMSHSFNTQYLSWIAEHRQTRTWYCALIVTYVTISKVIQHVALVKHDIHILLFRYGPQKPRREEQRHTTR